MRVETRDALCPSWSRWCWSYEMNSRNNSKDKVCQQNVLSTRFRQLFRDVPNNWQIHENCRRNGLSQNKPFRHHMLVNNCKPGKWQTRCRSQHFVRQKQQFRNVSRVTDLRETRRSYTTAHWRHPRWLLTLFVRSNAGTKSRAARLRERCWHWLVKVDVTCASHESIPPPKSNFPHEYTNYTGSRYVHPKTLRELARRCVRSEETQDAMRLGWDPSRTFLPVPRVAPSGPKTPERYTG